MTTSHTIDSAGMLRTIDAVHFGLDEASGLVNRIFDGVDSVLGLLAPEQVGGVRDGAADLRRTFDHTVADLGRALDRAGDPEALRAAGAAWAGIGSIVSDLSGLATENGIRADNHWTGDAADAYLATLLPQRLALGDVKTTSDKVDIILNELANAIVNFWKEVEGALLTLVTSLAVALAAVFEIITIPVAIGIAAGALVAFKDAVTSQITMFTELNNQISIRGSELGQRLNDNTNFRGGTWPPAAAGDLSDGSTTDGDDTDWHIA